MGNALAVLSAVWAWPWLSPVLIAAGVAWLWWAEATHKRPER